MPCHLTTRESDFSVEALEEQVVSGNAAIVGERLRWGLSEGRGEVLITLLSVGDLDQLEAEFIREVASAAQR